MPSSHETVSRTHQPVSNTLQHATTRCNTLQHAATHCNIQTKYSWKCVTLTPPSEAHTAIHYNTLQHTATRCNTLQHIATHLLSTRESVSRSRLPAPGNAVPQFQFEALWQVCSPRSQRPWQHLCVAVCCSVLQCVVVSVLQCVAVYCGVLWCVAVCSSAL